jgi:thiol-disulfide isomerase/thioredoxin
MAADSVNCETNKKQKTRITGHIDNNTGKFIVFINKFIKDTVYFNGLNNFKTDINLSHPCYLRLHDGKNNIKIFVVPGKNLDITYNSNNVFNSIRFKGESAVPNMYIRDKYLLMLDHAIPLSHLYSMPVKEFRQLTDSFYIVDKLFLEGFLNDNQDIPQIFKQTELASITYDRAAKLIEYLNATNTGYSDENTKYMNFLNSLQINDSSLLDVYEYRLFIEELADYYTNKQIKGKNYSQQKITLIKMQTILKTFDNKVVVDYALYSALKTHVKYYGYRNTEKLFKLFENKCVNENYRKNLLNPYYEYKGLSQAKVPCVTFSDISGNIFSLENFKGHYIYIDVWATWCLPCVKEIPYLEKLKAEYKSKNIEFISISVDKKRGDWIKFIEQKQLTENQFFAEKADDFLESFKIKSIPQFIIIDNKGYIVNLHAHRPSEANKKWFNSLPYKPIM